MALEDKKQGSLAESKIQANEGPINGKLKEHGYAFTPAYILAYAFNSEEVEVSQLEDAKEDKGQPVVQEALTLNVHLGTGVQQEL